MERMFDMPTCGGCRTCELACSYRHLEEFNPVVSSLKLVEKEDGVGYFISLVDAAMGPRRACDGCKGWPSRLCVDVCREEEVLNKMIDALLQKEE